MRKDNLRFSTRRLRRVIALAVCAFLLLSVLWTGQAETAVPETPPAETAAGELHALATIDNAAYQLTIKLLDFPDNQPQNTFLLDPSSSHGTKAFPELLSANLGEDGYPANREGDSLAELLADAVEVNHLFPEEPLQDHGIWEFDSTQCFASLQGNDFAVYTELGTIDATNKPTLDHGQFLPFNDLTPGLLSKAHPANTRDVLGNELPEEDPRQGEPLYAIPEKEANHYFALEMEAAFTCPAEETDAQGKEYEAYFSGDDDLWVYLDGVLVLDLGGVHSAIPGSINFSTGNVVCRGSDGEDQSVKLVKLFRERYVEAHPEAGEQEIQAYLDGFFHENEHWQSVLRDDMTHTLRLFYMERGAGASNLCMRFNLPILQKQAEGE